MPRDNGLPPVKLYYRIGEVAELVGVEPHVLRYWESEFPTIRPQKSRSGQRVYSRRDVDKLMRVKELLYAQRFTIAGARQRLRDHEFPDESGPPVGLRREPTAECGDVPVASGGSHDVSAAAATLRSTLVTVREKLLSMLDSLERGDGSRG